MLFAEYCPQTVIVFLNGTVSYQLYMKDIKVL